MADPWCEPCGSYHPVPRDAAHKAALNCFAPDEPISVTVSAGKPLSRRTKKAIGDMARAAVRSLTSEAHVQQTVVEFMELDGWRAMRTDPVSDRATVNAIRHKIMFDAASHPEHAGALKIVLALINGCVRGKGFGEPGMPDYQSSTSKSYTCTSMKFWAFTTLNAKYSPVNCR